MICGVQLLTTDSSGNIEQAITPFCAPDVKKEGRKARKSPGSKIDSGRIKNPIQKALIIVPLGVISRGLIKSEK
jgi:hypothetical protein